MRGPEDTEGEQPGPEVRAASAQLIVRRHMLWAIGTGLIPLPVLDIVAVTGIQISMLKELSELYGEKLSDDAARKLVGSLLSAVGGVTLGGMVVTSLLKLAPAVGVPLAMFAVPFSAGAFTYATGQMFMMQLESGGSFFELDPEALRAHFRREFERAKEAVARIQEEERAKAEDQGAAGEGR